MHSLYCGVTQTGKTTLARSHSRILKSHGQFVIVYDPVNTTTTHGGGWAADIITDDFDALLHYLETRRGAAHVFIDEAGEHFGVGDRDSHWLLTRGRHKGLFINLIAQRPKMLAPTVRTQCGRAYAFRMSPDDLTEIGQDFGHGQLGKTLLEKGDYLVLNSGASAIAKHNVFSVADSF